jgi:hypothetical protein
VPGATLSVSEALDADLDAYLDRELFVGSKVEPESRGPVAAAVSAASGDMRALLDLAEKESEWLKTLPAPTAPTVELASEPKQPEVVIPEWMRVAPGAKETLPLAAMLAPVAHEAVEVQPEPARGDAARPPTASWSEPVSAPVQHGNLPPGIAPSPAPSMAVQGTMLPPWTPPHAVPMAPVPPPRWGTPVAAAPEPTRGMAPVPPPHWGMPVAAAPEATRGMAPVPPPHWGVPVGAAPEATRGMGPVPPPHWGMPVAAAPEPTRIAGMRPGAFLGAAVVGALAAGLLVVAGLHLREHVTGTPGTTASTRSVGQEPSSTVAGGLSGTGTAHGQTPAAQARADASGSLPLSGPAGTARTEAPVRMGGQGVISSASGLAGTARTDAPVQIGGQGGTSSASGLGGTLQPSASGQMRGQWGSFGTPLSTALPGPALSDASGQVFIQGGPPGTSLFPDWTGTLQASDVPGPLGAQVAHSGGMSVGAVAVSQERVSGAQPLTGDGAGVSGPSGAQQAAASVAGTVLSTAQADVRGAADSPRASQPTAAPTSGPSVQGMAPTHGPPATVAAPEPSTRKASPKMANTVPTRTAVSTDEEADAPVSELSFDEAGADEESATPSEDGDTEAGQEATVSSAETRPKNAYSELDEDFARELGFTDDAEKKAVDPSASRTVYVPPAPDAKQHLTPDDVKAVVVANQPAITACIRQHARGTPVEGGGRFTVRWSVLPSGDTSGVAMDTDALRATPLARCIEDVVRRWKFPAHQVRMEEPIRFPFVF